MSFTFRLDKIKFLIFGKTPQDVCKEYNDEYNKKYFEDIDKQYSKDSIFAKWRKERAMLWYADDNKSPAEIMGLEMGKSGKQREIKAVLAENPHEECPYIEVDENGEIIPEQFELDYIKSKYDSEKYDIEEEITDYGGRFLTVTEKETNNNVVTYYCNDNHGHQRTIYIYDSFGDHRYHIDIEKGGLSGLLRKDDNDNYKIRNATEYLPDEHKSLSKLYTPDGELKSKRTYIYGNNIKDIIYRNGEPYKYLDEEQHTIKNLVVDELAECLQNKNFWGRIKEPEKLQSLMQKIDKENIYEILVMYKRKTGNSLYDDIKKGCNGWEIFGRRRTLRDDSIHDLNMAQRTYSWTADTEASNLYIEYAAERLAQNPNNISYFSNVASWDCEKLLNKYKEFAEKNNNAEVNTNLFETIMEDEKTELNVRINNVLSIIEKCKCINNSDLLKDITDVGYKIVTEHCKKGCDDIKDHMIVNKDNKKVLFIDLLRYCNRIEVTDPPEISKPNGEIDMEQAQGKTGDCWLLAGCISIYKKPEGKKILESLIDVNKETGDVVVSLKGVDKKYTVTYEEVKQAIYLSGGDGDIRAVEIAFNKYIHEKAIERESRGEVDINGNTVEFIYQVLLGNNEKIEKYNPLMNDMFNNPNKFYELGSGGRNIDTGKWLDYKNDLKDAMINSKGEPVDFVTGHAYAVIKADENYVYLINPWDSSETLRITPQKLESLYADVGIGWVNK